MNFRAPLVWSGLMVILACDPQAVAPGAAQDAGALDLTSNGGQDAGVSEDAGEGAHSGSLDGGWLDAGALDAGIACPPLTHWTADGCVSDVSVRLTGTAVAIRGDTLIAGPGQQPVLQVFVNSPPSLGSPAVTLEIAPRDSDGGAGTDQVHQIAEATSDDAGTHYDYAWNTLAAGEGLYTARAQASLGDAGFQSNPVYVLVDRTPPAIQLTINFDVDAGVQPRDFAATVGVVASDDGGSGEVGIGLSADGVVWARSSILQLRQAARVDLPVDLPTIEGSTTRLPARVHGADVPYDAWSTESDEWKIVLHATATDLAGNTGSVETEVPVTRQLWPDGVGSTGSVSLGPQGQILVNQGYSLDALFPDGTLQTRTKVWSRYGGPFVAALGRPATLVSRQMPDGETYVASADKGNPWPYSQISSVGGYGSKFQKFVPENAFLAAFALSASRGVLYALPEDCGVVAIDALTGEEGASASNLYASTCSEGQLAIGASVLISSAPSNSLISALPSLGEDWVRPQSMAFPGFPPLFLGDLGVFEVAGALNIYDPSQGGFSGVDLVAPYPAHAVSSSSGDLYFMGPNGILSKTDGKGTQLWTRKLKTGVTTTGLVLGSSPRAGAGETLVYAVDGSGRIWAYDSTGEFHWSSPANTAEGDLMIDRCTGHAYASVGGPPTAVVLDSLGVDASPSSWPMGGHDVFQTYDSQSAADVDCAGHL